MIGARALRCAREANAAAEEVIQLCGADRITEHSCQTQIRKCTCSPPGLLIYFSPFYGGRSCSGMAHTFPPQNIYAVCLIGDDTAVAMLLSRDDFQLNTDWMTRKVFFFFFLDTSFYLHALLILFNCNHTSF